MVFNLHKEDVDVVMRPNMCVEMACYTDTGLVRDQNEDYVDTDEANGLVVLADGMGGYQAGEVASELAVKTIIDCMQTQLNQFASFAVGDEASCGVMANVLKQAVIKANQEIFTAANNESRYQGMGTTVVAALFYHGIICMAHVGDSRLYRLRGNEFKQLTKDHSVLQDLIDCGYYTPEQARHASNRNLVTRALGVSHYVTVDIQQQALSAEDIYLLCSDGLHDMLKDQEIETILKGNQYYLTDAAHALIDAANAKGGVDNISVALVRVISNRALPHKNWWQKLMSWSFLYSIG